MGQKIIKRPKFNGDPWNSMYAWENYAKRLEKALRKHRGVAAPMVYRKSIAVRAKSKKELDSKIRNLKAYNPHQRFFITEEMTISVGGFVQSVYADLDVYE